MIEEYDLMGFSNRFRDIRQLERDYLLVLLLHEIYSTFTNELVFKGGSALKYFYNLNRFSEDIDLSYMPAANASNGKYPNEKMSDALDSFSMQYQITERERRTHKTGAEIDGIGYEIRVRGPLNQRLGQLQNIKIDTSLRNDIVRKPELKYLSPAYPDITTFSLPVMNIDEMLAEKIAAVATRTKMRDVYDIYYLLAIRGLKYDQELVEEKMRRRMEAFKKEELAKKLEAARDKMKWRSELAYIVNPLPDNLEVVSKLKEALDL